MRLGARTFKTISADQASLALTCTSSRIVNMNLKVIERVWPNKCYTSAPAVKSVPAELSYCLQISTRAHHTRPRCYVSFVGHLRGDTEPLLHHNQEARLHKLQDGLRSRATPSLSIKRFFRYSNGDALIASVRRIGHQFGACRGLRGLEGCGVGYAQRARRAWLRHPDMLQWQRAAGSLAVARGQKVGLHRRARGAAESRPSAGRAARSDWKPQREHSCHRAGRSWL